MRILLSLILCASLAGPAFAKIITTTTRPVSSGTARKQKKVKKFKAPKTKKMKKAKVKYGTKHTTTRRA